MTTGHLIYAPNADERGKKLRGDSLVPVGLGITVQGWEHDGQDLGGVVADQAHDVLIVPVVQSSLCHLTAQEVLACEGGCIQQPEYGVF